MSDEQYKKKMYKVIKQRHLCSIMNNTKWDRLLTAVLERLPFPPPYQVKYVVDDKLYPEDFETDVWYHGDWKEGLFPFYSVEWIRVRPTYSKPRGFLVSREIIDIREEFLSLLIELRIPFKKELDTFYIYGYASDTSYLTIGD